jgi:uncharacterized protein YutE (UPF0331/DUF86 family)
MDKKQVQEALSRIGGILSKARFTEPLLNREDHVVLSRDMQLIQQCCVAHLDSLTACKSYEEPEDGRTNIIPIRPEPIDEDSEGGGDSV